MKKKKIKFCKKCLYSENHPLGLIINEEGICSGCIVHAEKNQLNWVERDEKLKKIIVPYKSKGGKNYDCIVPVTGGQDTYFILHNVKKLGLKPLLVSYNKYFNTDIGIKNLTNLRIKFDSDIIYQNVNPLSVKKITQYTFSEYGNIYWPILAGHTVFPLQIAEKYKIPLIIWGAHQGMEQVGMYSHLHEVEMTRRYRNDHDIINLEAEDLLKISNNLNEDDIFQYIYPDDQTIKSIGIRGIYLGNYIRWDPLSQHLEMIKKYGYIGTNFNRTFDCYDYVDCFNYMNIHDFLKICKHGYSKVTDHACREIRHNRISREQGLNLVKMYENNLPNYLDMFSNWLGLRDLKSFNYLVNRFKNRLYWTETDVDKWKFEGLSKRIIDIKKLKKSNNKNSNLNKKYYKKKYLKDIKNSKYIIFGKGID